MSNLLSLKPSYYEALKRLTLELAGIKLGDEHAFLVETRLSALSRKEGFENLSQMIDELFSRGQTRLAVQVVSALLERASRFFEDREGYELIGDKLLPELHRSYKGGIIRILSYGCSSGQEAYSVAILADKILRSLPGMTVEVTGIDYPSMALDRARHGRFTHFEVQRGLPIQHLVDYFKRDGEDWVIKDEIRKNVRFVDHNLLAKPDALGKFQIALFRGKIKHYSPPALVSVLRTLSAMVSDNGYLVLGTDEDLGRLHFGFETEPFTPGCYRKEAKLEDSEPIIRAPQQSPVFETDQKTGTHS